MDTATQDHRYLNAAEEYAPALDRLARGYEADPDRRRDLLQEIHLALWRSMTRFDGRCSLRTWVYRVAHNAAASHIARNRRVNAMRLVSLEELAEVCSSEDQQEAFGNQQAIGRLTEMIRSLESPDRQVMLLYLEDVDAVAIGEVTGLSPGAVATRIHRIKTVISKRFREGGADVG